jgi:Lipase (class 3)
VDTTGWQLVVTGHSLGAGAAALVALYAHNYFPRCAAALQPPCTYKTLAGAPCTLQFEGACYRLKQVCNTAYCCLCASL